MPRKAAAVAAPADGEAAPTQRRSSRIAEKPAPPPPPPKKPAAPRKKRAKETEADEKEDGEPAAKKAKASEEPATASAEEKTAEEPKATEEVKPAEETKTVEEAAKPVEEEAAKPASKPASKAAAGTSSKPASKATKPASKAAASSKPASKAKPASKGKPASKAKVAEAKEAPSEDKPEPIPEEKEDVAMEDVSATAEAKELQVGDTLPAGTTLPNEKGEELNLVEVAEKGAVVFIVPKADTSGCNTQACAFRDSYAEFEKLGYAVYGLSADPSDAGARWQTKKNLPYSLLSDPKRKVIALLGASAKGGSGTKRSHVIFEKTTGKLVEKKITVKPEQSSKMALEFLKTKYGGEAAA